MTDDHETMDESPVKTIAAARSKYVVCFSGKQYHVPEHAVVKKPTRPCPVADGASLGSILTSKSCAARPPTRTQPHAGPTRFGTAAAGPRSGPLPATSTA